MRSSSNFQLKTEQTRLHPHRLWLLKDQAHQDLHLLLLHQRSLQLMIYLLHLLQRRDLLHQADLPLQLLLHLELLLLQFKHLQPQ